MAERTTDDDIVEAIYEASERPDLWDEVFSSLARRFMAYACSFYTQNFLQTEGRMRGADIALVQGCSSSALTSYWDHFYSLNPFILNQHQAATGEIITEAKNPTWRNGEFYEDWARPQKFEHVATEFLRRSDNGVLTICAFWRGAPEGAFTGNEIRQLDRFLRHIGRSIHVRDRLQQAGAILASAHAGAGGSIGIATLGAGDHVRHLDALAEDIVSRRDGLFITHRRLATTSPKDQQALDDFIAGALHSSGEAFAAELRTLSLPRPGGGSIKLTLSRPGVGFGRFTVESGAMLVLSIETAPDAPCSATDRLGTAFRLTPGEKRLLAELAQGGTLREVADRLRIGHETARTQIKAIFDKTGVRRQVELVALLHRA